MDSDEVEGGLQLDPSALKLDLGERQAVDEERHVVAAVLAAALDADLSQVETITISDALGQECLDQLGAERLIVSYTRGHPVRAWEKISGRRNEALDCLTYAVAARRLVEIGRTETDAGPTESGLSYGRRSLSRSAWIHGY